MVGDPGVLVVLLPGTATLIPDSINESLNGIASTSFNSVGSLGMITSAQAASSFSSRLQRVTTYLDLGSSSPLPVYLLDVDQLRSAI